MAKQFLLLFCVILCLVIKVSFSQSSSLPASSIGSAVVLHEITQLDLVPFIEVFVDSTNTLSINHVSDPDFKGTFLLNNERRLHFDFDTLNRWIRIKIISQHSYTKPYVIDFQNSTIDDIQMFYKYSDFLISSSKSGDRLPFHTRQIRNRNFAYKLELSSDVEYTMYFKINSGGDALNLPVSIYTLKGFSNKVSKEYLFFGIFYGIIISMLISIFIVVMVSYKFKTHIFYIAYVLLIGVWNFNLDGFGFQFLYPYLPWLTNMIVILLPLAAIISLSIFTLEFFEIKKNRIGLYRLITGLNIVTFLFMILTLFGIINYYTNSVIMLILGSVTVLTITISAILLYKKAPKLSVYYILSFVILMLIIFIFSSNILSGVFDSIIRDNAIKIGFTFQTFILFLAISLRFRMLQDRTHQDAILHLNEINEIKDKANAELENKVKERTYELEKSNQDFKIANEELQLERKQRLESRKQIEEQNILLEAKNTDITDSINYAQRIQKSIFPADEFVKKLLPDSFIYLKPKDVLSGDFYWIDEFALHISMGAPKNTIPDYIMVAAVDCTGHGVPGALMSIVARNIINQIVKEDHISEPGEVLRELNKGIYKTLSYDIKESIGKDGMDLSLIKIDLATRIMTFAGAKNSAYLIRNGEIDILKGSNFSIGNSYDLNRVLIKQKEVKLLKGDVVYMFSDGYADQKGGIDGKRFKYRLFRELLLSIYDKPMDEQKQILDDRLTEWRRIDKSKQAGLHEQIDDILIIGFRMW